MTIKYIVERSYPYIISIVFFSLLVWKKINYINSSSLESALDAVMTVCSLIIGFFGTLIPIVIGLKSESEFIKYLLEDEDRLFVKYVKEAIAGGFFVIIYTVVMYFREDINKEFIVENMFYGWILVLTIFCLQAYRSMSFMLSMIFEKDKKIEENLDDKIPDETEAEKLYKNTH